MFGRVTITLGIGPHSSFNLLPPSENSLNEAMVEVDWNREGLPLRSQLEDVGARCKLPNLKLGQLLGTLSPIKLLGPNNFGGQCYAPKFTHRRQCKRYNKMTLIM